MKFFRPAKEILNLFSGRQKKLLILFQLFQITVAVLQVLGLSSIMPFIAVLTNPESIETVFYLRWIYDFLEFRSPRSFLFFLGSFFIVFLVFSNAVLAFNTWLESIFIAKVGVYFSSGLFDYFLSRDFLFFSKNHSAVIINKLTIQISRFIGGLIRSVMKLISSATLIVLISASLFLVSPQISIVVTLGILASYFLIYKMFRKRMGIWGEKTSEFSNLKNKIIANGVSGHRELKVYHLEANTASHFKETERKLFYIDAKIQLVQLLPKYFIEMLAFGGLILICFYFIGLSQSASEFLPIISFFALAGYRTLPQAQSLYSSVGSIKTSFDAYEQMKEDLTACCKKPFFLRQDVSGNRLPFEERIELEKVSFKYPESNERQLQQISIAIPKKGSVAFVGKTGCGKTTLVNVILGLIVPQSGRLMIDGKTVDHETIGDWQNNLAFVSQDLFLLDDTILRNIAFNWGNEPEDREKAIACAKNAEIHDFVSSLPHRYDTFIGERGIKLSGGQRQRIAIARALYREPEVLILDEATSALDNETERKVMESIENVHGVKTLVTIAHRLNTVRNCDRVYLMDGGRIVDSGTFDELVERNEMFGAEKPIGEETATKEKKTEI